MTTWAGGYAASLDSKLDPRDDAGMVDLDDLRAEYRNADLDDKQPFETWAKKTLIEALDDAIEYKKLEEEFAKIEESSGECPSRGTPMPDVDLSSVGDL